MSPVVGISTGSCPQCHLRKTKKVLPASRLRLLSPVLPLVFFNHRTPTLSFISQPQLNNHPQLHLSINSSTTSGLTSATLATTICLPNKHCHHPAVSDQQLYHKQLHLSIPALMPAICSRTSNNHLGLSSTSAPSSKLICLNHLPLHSARCAHLATLPTNCLPK